MITSLRISRNRSGSDTDTNQTNAQICSLMPSTLHRDRIRVYGSRSSGVDQVWSPRVHIPLNLASHQTLHSLVRSTKTEITHHGTYLPVALRMRARLV